MCLTGALNNRYIIKANSIASIKSRASKLGNKDRTKSDRLRVTGEGLLSPIILYRKNEIQGYKHIPGSWYLVNE